MSNGFPGPTAFLEPMLGVQWVCSPEGNVRGESGPLQGRLDYRAPLPIDSFLRSSGAADLLHSQRSSFFCDV